MGTLKKDGLTLVKMEKQAAEQEIMEVKVGQWVKVHFTDSKPIWALVMEKPKKRNKCLHLYFPQDGVEEDVDFDQISIVGGMVETPE